MFKIDIHTHIIPENLNQITNSFDDPRFLKLEPENENSASLLKNNILFRKINCNCWDPQQRILECDSSNVDIQVLSTIPVLFSYWANIKEGLKLSEFLNDHIAKICSMYPNKFLGLGTIPMQDTDKAIIEMDRCMNQLDFCGIQIGSNINGDNLSDKKFHPIFEYAEQIDCSIFVHPWEMMGQTDLNKYWLPWLVGMPAETSRAICSIIFGGILEKYPKLKFAFAHGGGAFPFTVGRIDQGFKVRPDLCAVDNGALPSSYLKHFYIDSLVHDEDTMLFLINKLGENQIALGSDYPFPLGEYYPGKLIEEMDISLLIKERILSGTAIEWLGINKNEYDNKE
tara:strand:- start:703 stop:1722 length:1020 start_codon:yes stop_codon:yes gene_type:complete